MLLSRRLFPRRGLLALVLDFVVHAAEGGIDRGRLHAHGLGTAGAGLCHSAPAGARAGVRRDHGLRVGLHPAHQGVLLWCGPLSVGGAAMREEGIAKPVIVCNAHIREKDFVELTRSGHLLDRTHFYTGRAHVDDEHRQPLVLGLGRVCPCNDDAIVRAMRARGPHFLAVHDPLVAVTNGTGLQRREIRARPRLAEQLAPDLAVHDPRKESVLLLGGAAGGIAGLAAARRLSTNARLARTLFAWLILVVAAYVAWRALGG